MRFFLNTYALYPRLLFPPRLRAHAGLHCLGSGDNTNEASPQVEVLHDDGSSDLDLNDFRVEVNPSSDGSDDVVIQNTLLVRRYS